MDDFERIRRLVLVEGFSQRKVAKQWGVARKSIRKAIQRPYPADYTLKVPRPCPMLDSVKPIIDAWLDQDRVHRSCITKENRKQKPNDNR
jgi:hypothetical protein